MSPLALERVLPIALLAVAVFSVPAMVWSPTGMARLDVLRAERAEVDAQISGLRQELRQLRARVEGMKNDPRAIERAARDELGLVRRTEVVLQFSE